IRCEISCSIDARLIGESLTERLHLSRAVLKSARLHLTSAVLCNDVDHAHDVRLNSSTPKAFASSSPGLEQPWVKRRTTNQRCKRWQAGVANAFSVQNVFSFGSQGSRKLEPWAGIS